MTSWWRSTRTVTLGVLEDLEHAAERPGPLQEPESREDPEVTHQQAEVEPPVEEKALVDAPHVHLWEEEEEEKERFVVTRITRIALLSDEVRVAGGAGGVVWVI